MFTAAQVAQLAGAEEPAAARAFQQLMDFGAGFFNIGRELPNGAGLHAIEFSKGNLFDYYRQYNGIEDLLERAYTRPGKDFYAAESHAVGQASAVLTADIGLRLMQLLQLYELDTASTVQLKNVSHEQLVAAFNLFVFHHSARLGINGWADNIQSLRDGGVDAVWQFEVDRRREKFGTQVKSWGDVESTADTFRRTVMAKLPNRGRWAFPFFSSLCRRTSPIAHRQRKRAESWQMCNGCKTGTFTPYRPRKSPAYGNGRDELTRTLWTKPVKQAMRCLP